MRLVMSVPELSFEAGTFPLSLRDQLSAGDPVEITMLAEAFAKAANDQTLAAELATQQLQLTIGGYTGDQGTVVDYDAEAAATSAALDGNAASLQQIAVTLDSVSDALATHTHSANSLVDQLESDVAALAKSYWAKADTGVWPPEDLEQLAANLHASAVALVATCGASVQSAIDEYEAILAGAQMTLADLGYLAPDALDEGPGDVGVPTPDVAATQAILITSTPPSAGQDAALVTATAYLTLLNRKSAAGVPLSTAEQAWLTSFYEQTVPYFPQMKTWADQAPPGTTDPVTQIADGLLLLSLVVPVAKLPTALLEVLSSNVGVVQPGWNGQVGSRPVNWPPAGDPALDRAAATLGLLADYSSDDVEPSAELAQDLKDAALRWKQQTNAMYANYVYDVQTWTPSYTGQPPPAVMTAAQWNAMFPDAASSDALTLVAKNAAYSNDWIVNDPEGRRTVMALNWNDGRGAAAVLVSAALPSETVGAGAAAQAALVIVEDASSDYAAFAGMSNSSVDAAITGIGIAYVDSFASPDRGVPGVTTLTLTDGSAVVGFHLDPGAESAFVKYLVAADPSLYGAFREAAVQRTSALALNLVTEGRDLHDPAVVRALDHGAWFIGMIDSSGAAYLTEQSQTTAADVVDKVASAQAGVDPALADTIATVMAGVAEVVPGETAESLANAATPALIQLLSMLDSPPPPPSVTPIDGLVSALQTLALENSATAQAMVQTDTTVTDLVVRTAAAAGEPILDPGGVPVVAQPDGTYSFDDGNTVFRVANVGEVWNSADSGTQAALASGKVNSTATAGAGSAFVPTASGCAVGIGDQLGNWSDNGEQNFLYYGDAQAWATTSTTGEAASLSPDADAHTDEPRPVVTAPA